MLDTHLQERTKYSFRSTTAITIKTKCQSLHKRYGEKMGQNFSDFQALPNWHISFIFFVSPTIIIRTCLLSQIIEDIKKLGKKYFIYISQHIITFRK